MSSIYFKIKKKTLLFSLLSVLCIGSATFAGMFYMRENVIGTGERIGSSAANDSKSALEQQTEESLTLLVKSKAAASDSVFEKISQFVGMITWQVSEIELNFKNYTERKISFPDAVNDGILTAQLRVADNEVFETNKRDIGLLSNIQDLLKSVNIYSNNVRSAYIGTETGISISADMDSALKNNEYDPRSRPWYISAKEKNSLVWTDVFEDNSGRGLAITCAQPFYDKNGKILGVAGIGMTLENLKKDVADVKIGKTGHAFIINETGELIISDISEKEENGKILKDSLFINGSMTVETLKKLIEKKSGIKRINLYGNEYFLAFESLSALPWYYVIAISVDEIISPALKSEQSIISLKDNALKNADFVIVIYTLIFGLIFTIVIVSNVFLVKKLAKNISQPIINLSKNAAVIGNGDLSHKLDVKTDDELETLAETINIMIDNIKHITSEKERIFAELGVAAKIQSSMLPRLFIPPCEGNVDIHAVMNPAKEVGGDLYDYFYINKKCLAVVIADVSGKSVPAALFMVIAKTAIKNNALLGKQPKEVFESANKILCENNDENMFVTAFMGFLNIDTGTFIYVNAGHNPPVIQQDKKKSKLLPLKPGFALGIKSDAEYIQSEITLGKNDMILLYTDGVTEAVNKKQQLFTDKRLLDIIVTKKIQTPKMLIMSIENELNKFTDKEEQMDDITMLALKYGKSFENTLSIPAEKENLSIVLRFIANVLEYNKFSEKKKWKTLIATEEIFINIANYAYKPGTGNVIIQTGYDNDFYIEFIDEGTPYNPDHAPVPDTTLPINRRTGGGLGILMTKRFVDYIDYKHENGKNKFKLYCRNDF